MRQLVVLLFAATLTSAVRAASAPEVLVSTLTSAGIPIAGVSLARGGTVAQARVDFSPAATQAQKTRAAQILAVADISPAALAAFDVAQAKVLATTVLVDGIDPEARAIRAVAAACLAEINVLRAQAGLTPLTAAQWRTEIRNGL